MRMKKIRLDFKYCERGRFYRTLLVKEDINLVDLGCAILTAFNAAFEHNFYYHTKEFDFLPRSFMEDVIRDNEVLMNDYTLEVLGDSFEFLYDTGDGWDFKGKVYNKIIEQEFDDPDDDVLLLAGAGLGIYEDNISTLYNYFEGKLNPNSGKEDALNSLPWNLDMKKYGDFDSAFDIEEEKERFSGAYLIDRDEYWKNEREYFGDDGEGAEKSETLGTELHDFMVEQTHLQIREVDYVDNTFNRLIKKYSEEETIDKMAIALLTAIYYSGKNAGEFDEDKYKELLSELK